MIKHLPSFCLKITLALLFFTSTLQATTFTVSNTSRYDSWQTPVVGSLRKALADAAAAGVGPHTIVFDFGALGSNPVFSFTGDEYINNTSNFALDGNGVTLDALAGRPGGGSVTFTSAPYVGNALFVVRGSNNTLKGITFTSTTDGYGLLVTGSGHTIQQNIFINNMGVGLRLNNTTNAMVKNNVIENNAMGGIYLDGANNGANLGGCGVGEGNTIIRNGFSASTARDDIGNGITFGSQTTSCTATAGNPILIRGNYIGTNAAFDFQDGSTNFLGNSHHGISIWQSSNVIIGGACPNYVSNNGFRRTASGISVYASTSVTVDGNIVGTDGTTGKKIGNMFDGILIHAAQGNTVTNNIVGNSVNGIAIRNSIGAPGVQPTNNNISNNKIGIDNGGRFISNSGAGITLENNAANNTVQSNTIKSTGIGFSYGNGKPNPASNAGTGIWIVGNSAGNQGNSVFLNVIGRQSSDPATANNAGNAILIDRSTNNLIGDVSKGNSIGSNGTTSDIVVDGATTIRNKITYNQFTCSGSFATKGIELRNTGNINFGNPSSVFVDMSSSGTITGGAPANSTVHVYTRAANCNQCLSATTGNYSRANTFLGTTTATASGTWSYTTVEPASNIVVTATDANGNTSEFSYCDTPLGLCPTAAAGPDQTICNLTTATLAGNDPTVDGGAGAWTVISGTGTVTTPSDPASGVTGLTVGASTTFRWTVTKAGCTTTFDDIIITVSSPVVANAPTSTTICNSTTSTITASTATGTWSRSAGTGTVTSPTSQSSGVTGLTVGGSSTFQWTVSNGACSGVLDQVTITVSSPVVANAPTSTTICNSTTSTITASTATGTWSVSSGTGTVTSPSSQSSGVTGLTVGGSSTFQWTVSNGACSGVLDQVTITVSSPVVANAPTSTTICNSTTSTINASTATGTWSVSAGTGSVTSPSSQSSGVTGLTVGASSTFQWTVSNGACSGVLDQVTITVSSPVVANAPTSTTICNSTTSTITASTATGTWSRSAGTGAVTSPSSQSSGVTGLTVGASSTFQWTVSNGACSGVLDQVTITVSSPVVANAPTSTTICNSTTSTINASTTTGTWSVSSGTGTVTSPSSQSSGVTGLTVGASSTFQWTVNNGACSGVLDQVTINVSSPVVANAPTSTTICNSTTSTITASTATGTWSRSAGTGTVTSPSSQSSGVTGLTVGASSTFQWTVSNGACSGVLDQVTITVSSPVVANTPSSTTLCNVTTTTITASTATGTWSRSSGTGTVTSPTSQSSGVTGLTIGGTSVFQWTVMNGACSGVLDQVTVTVIDNTSITPVDQDLCNSTVATLSATGSGTWSTESGTGVATTPTSPTSGVTGLTIGGTTVFAWTASSGSCSGQVTERVNITSYTPVTAVGGPSPLMSCGVTVDNLEAVGTGTWTKIPNRIENSLPVYGTGVIAPGEFTNPIAEVTNLTIGDTTTYHWTVSNGPCIDRDTVELIVTTPPVLSAGGDFGTCLSSFALQASNPGNGYVGTWTSTDPNVVFTPTDSPNAIVTGLSNGSTVLTWSLATYGGCTGSYVDQVTIAFGASGLSVDLIAPDDTACVGTPRTLHADAVGGSGDYAYVWVSNLDIDNPVLNANAIVDTTDYNEYAVSPNDEKNLYWVLVIDKANRGCATPFEDDTIYAINGQDLNIPNLITPNDDGKNDYWVLKDKVTGQEVLPGTRFDLYNRWGQKTFTMDSYDNRFKAEHISDGIYYYYVKSGCGDKEYKGWLQILGNNKP